MAVTTPSKPPLNLTVSQPTSSLMAKTVSQPTTSKFTPTNTQSNIGAAQTDYGKGLADSAGGLAAVISKGGPTLDNLKTSVTNYGKTPTTPAPGPTQIGGFGGKVIEGDGSASFDKLAGNTADLHWDTNTNSYQSSNSAVNEAAKRYGVPIGPDGKPNFDYANNEIRKQFGLPEIQYQDGIKMYKDPGTGRWIADPNGKSSSKAMTDMTAEQDRLMALKGFTKGPAGYMQTGPSQEGSYNPGSSSAGGSPESVLRDSVAGNPGGFIPGTNNTNGMRGRVLGADVTQPGVDSDAVNEDVKNTIGKGGSVPKVNKPGEVQAGSINLGYEPGDKFDARGADVAGQIKSVLQNSDSKILNALTDRIHFSEQGAGRGAAYIGGFGSSEEAYRAMAELQKSLDPELLGKLKISVERNPSNGKFQIQFRGDVIPAKAKSENKDEAPGGPIDNNVKSVEDSNKFNQELRDLIGQLVIQAQQNKGKSFGAAQDALGREIPGVGETSPEQEAQVQRQIAAMREQGVEQISRDFNQNVRGISADLLNRGFAGSNVVSPNLEEGAFRPSDIARRDLMKTLVTQENAIRDSIANRQNNAVTTLNNINEPGFPTNVPGVTQLQSGTFTPKATFADAAELAKIFLVTIPGMDQQTALELAKSYIDANSETVVSPSGGAQLLEAGSNVVGGALGSKK